MRYLITLIVLTSITLSPSYGQFGKLLKKVEDAVGLDSDSGNIGAGLKEALEVGVNDAVSSLSAADGYFESHIRSLFQKRLEP